MKTIYCGRMTKYLTSAVAAISASSFNLFDDIASLFSWSISSGIIKIKQNFNSHHDNDMYPIAPIFDLESALSQAS